MISRLVLFFTFSLVGLAVAQTVEEAGSSIYVPTEADVADRFKVLERAVLAGDWDEALRGLDQLRRDVAGLLVIGIERAFPGWRTGGTLKSFQPLLLKNRVAG